MSIRLGGTIPLEQCRQYMSPKNDPHHWKYICIEGMYRRMLLCACGQYIHTHLF